MSLSTVPDMMALGCSGIRAVSEFSVAILADLAMRGFPISFSTPARIALLGSFLVFVFSMHYLDIETEAMQSHFAQLRDPRSVPLRTTFVRWKKQAKFECVPM